RYLCLVGNTGLLSIEQRHLRRLENVRSSIPLCRLDHEKRLNVAQYGEAECGRRPGVESAEWRRHSPETALAELNVFQGRWIASRIQTNDRAGAERTIRRRGACHRRWTGNGGGCRNVKIKIDSHLLEEIVFQSDEAHFNRDLQVLQAAQLLQQVRNFLIDLLRLADDQAQDRIEPLERTLPPLIP